MKETGGGNSLAERNEKKKQMLKLRGRVLQAEQECIQGVRTMSVSEARKRLRERVNMIEEHNLCK